MTRTDATDDGLCLELHPDGQLKTLVFLSAGEVIGRSLHLDPDTLAGEVREVAPFAVDPDVEATPETQYKDWVEHAIRAISDRAKLVFRCSFCAKHSGEVSKIIQGPECSICSDCIELCGSILANESSD